MVACYSCGFENPDGVEWCQQCGKVLPFKKIPPKTQPDDKFPKDFITRVEDHPPGWRAQWSMALGILSFLLLLLTGVCAPVSGIFAIVLGNTEMKTIRTKRYSERGKTYCQIGIWCGYMASSMSLLLLAYGMVAGAWFFNWFREALQH